MTRKYFYRWQPEEKQLDVLVVFNGKYFWEATFTPEGSTHARTRLFSSRSGLCTLSGERQAALTECEEEEFWKNTGKHSHFIRWAISAYTLHLLQSE
jgi:hypothetical protein